MVYKNLNQIFKNQEIVDLELESEYEELKNVIDNPIKFITNYNVELSDCVVRMSRIDYIVNLMFWRAMSSLNRIPAEKDIFDTSNITAKDIKNYIDNTYTRRYRSETESVKLNVLEIEIIENLKRFEEDFGVILGVTYNIYQIWQLFKSSPKFKSILQTKIPQGLQPNEIEEFGKTKLKELTNELVNSNTGFKPLIESGAGIKLAQLQELMAIICNKPGLDGNTLTMPVNTNIFYGGLSTPSDYIIDSIAGRKALIMNKKYTGKSGYFSRKLNLVTIDTKLHDDPDYDCHTKHYLKFKIDDEESLSRLEGRYYKTKKDSPFLRMIQYNDTKLIGKTILLRSPITCASDHICRYCYGELYYINNAKDNAINVGVLGATTMSSRFTQNILSSKHSLMTKSQKIILNEGFEKYFILDTNQILLDTNNIENINSLFFCINANEIELDLEDEIDENEEINTDGIKIYEEITIPQLKITNGKDCNNVVYSLKDVNDLQFKITSYFKNMIEKYDRNKKYIYVPLSAIDPDEVIGDFDVTNAELTKTLNLVKNILEQEDHNGCNTIDDLVYTLNRLLIEGGIHMHLVHAEIICRNLVRDNKDILERPDFTKDEVDYIILTVKKAIMKNRSPLVSISFERVEEQFRNILTYKKNKKSIFDTLFLQQVRRKYAV